MGILSFNGNKIITTGGGGAILTNDPEIAKKAKHITQTAKVPHKWEYIHDELGFNYRLPNINAALGCAQLENIEKFLKMNRKLFHKYKKQFDKLNGVNLVEEPYKCSSNYWLQTLILDKNNINIRDTILDLTNSEGVMTRPVWKMLNTLKPFLKSPQAPLPISSFLEKQLINIPSRLLD